ncbi:MAG: dethiobiotin synthase [Shewanella sp.]
MGKILFVSGIDTDVGKTIATGFLAKKLMDKGFSVITQKLVQTGCTGIAADLITHRQIQGIALTADDLNGTTCPYVFDYPCSPHLAAELAHQSIDIKKITASTAHLSARYDYVLLEGAGGLAVPYHQQATILDYIATQAYPLILVSSSKLGSINHTLLSLMACQQYNITVDTLVYNHYPQHDELITQSTQQYLKTYLSKHFPKTHWLDLEYLAMT